MKNMLFTVIDAMDQHLEKGMTYVYLMMQTDQLEVTAISATPISVPQDTNPHSSRELNISQWRITKCLESTSDNKQVRGLHVNCYDDSNYFRYIVDQFQSEH